MRTPLSDDQLAWTVIARKLWLPEAAVLVSAPDGTVVRASEQAAELAGEASPDGLVGRRVTELLVPDGAVLRLRGRGPGLSLVRTVTWLHGDDDRLRVTALVDISDLAEVSSRVPVHRRVGRVEPTAGLAGPALRDVQRAARIGMWEWDAVHEVIRPSGVLRELTGRQRDVGVPFEEYLAAVHPDDQARVREAWSVLVNHQHPVEVEHRYVRPDATVRMFRVRGTATRDDEGRVHLSGTVQDITDQRETAPATFPGAGRDAITGLPNRAAAHELLAGLLGQTGAGNVAVLTCRIDNFKRIVTSLGHDAGDELLVVLARRLTDGLGQECIPARVTGEDEFAIICSGLATSGELDALTVQVSGLMQTPAPIRGRLLQVSTSIGAAVHDGQAGVEDLLRFATAAMGEAREQGLGQVHQAGPALMTSADQQVRIEGELREAVHRGELEVHYQPIVGADGTILAAEALVRWSHPDRGLLTPGAFLPVAERGGLLRELDHWVLRTALHHAARWHQPHGRHVGIAVNLSGLVPADPGFDDLVEAAVADSGLDWQRLILELVETELGKPRVQTRQGMLGVARRGARFAIDDFGTGYSSLARFKHLPTALIKIDRQFTAGVEDDLADRALVQSIIDMTHALERRCIVEGVETAGQFHALVELGADAYQGWLFTRAMPEADFSALLTRSPLYVPPREA
ncbi:hypothetical protein GCM10027174_40550 [Salinifilum aidingensis]